MLCGCGYYICHVQCHRLEHAFLCLASSVHLKCGLADSQIELNVHLSVSLSLSLCVLCVHVCVCVCVCVCTCVCLCICGCGLYACVCMSSMHAFPSISQLHLSLLPACFHIVEHRILLYPTFGVQVFFSHCLYVRDILSPYGCHNHILSPYGCHDQFRA